MSTDTTISNHIYNLHLCNGNSVPEHNKVSINNVNDFRKMLFCIGDCSYVSIDNDLEPDLYAMWERFQCFGIENIIDEIKCDYRNPDDALRLLSKIPITESIQQKLNTLITPIDKEYVHKSNLGNVFITSPIETGKLFFFRGFNEIDEIQIDHYSDHFDGIKIFEAARQASIAAMALAGFATEAVNILTKNTIFYEYFIEHSKPYYIQTLPAVRPQGGALYCVFLLIQDNRICVKGYFAGVGYKSREMYARMTNRLEK